MTAPIVPGMSPTDARIAALLKQGLPVDRVAELGVYRGTKQAPAWTRADVERVAAALPAPEPPAPSPCACQPDMDEVRWEPPTATTRRAVTLSARQAQVFDLLCEGLTGPEIAERIGVTEFTVRTMLKRVRRAMGARNGLHAVVLAITGQVVVTVDEDRGKRRAS